MSTPSLKFSLIRIWSKETPDKSSFIVGAGFVVTAEHMVTCAHVINTALGRDEKDSRLPDVPIFLDFLGTDSPLTEAGVLHWFPVRDNSESNELEDIAVLKLIDPLPAGVSPVSFAKAGEQVNRVRMCGFPGDASDGTYVTGIVQGVIKNGWIELHPEDNRSADPGFSGTAAWDMEQHAVCGMIVSRQIRAGGIHNVYMIPAEKLIKAIPDMNKHIFSNGHALIIGVQTYSSPLGDLPCTLEDAKGLAGILKDEGRCAYPAEQVLLLKDSKADRNGILASLDRLAKVTDANSTVVIYFSGHGGKKDGGYYFCPHGFNPAALKETAISGPEFTNKIAAIPAKKKLILLDCCHAGGIGSGVKGEGFNKASVPLEAIELFHQGKGCVVIASSNEEEKSYIGEPYSIFTGVLIEVLCGKGVSIKDGYVRVSDLAMHTRERVPGLTEEKQHPALHFEKADNFVLAYYAGGEKEAKDVSFVLQVDVSEQSGTMEQRNGLLENMNGLLKDINDIEWMFVEASYKQAFRELYLLCKNVEKCKEFSQRAMSIFRQYNELKEENDNGFLESSQYEVRKGRICFRFESLLLEIKEKFNLN